MIEAIVLAHLMYSFECCADKHCRPVPCEEIISDNWGWKWRGHLFDRSMFRESPDGVCHVCTSPQPVCIYLPPRV